MAKLVIWSEMAENDLESILSYLIEVWGIQVNQQFLFETFSTIDKISHNPKLFPIIKTKEKIRKCVLTKHNSLFYKENKNHVIILRIFDNRQDPHKLTFKK